jgi:hypothetical protein
MNLKKRFLYPPHYSGCIRSLIYTYPPCYMHTEMKNGECFRFERKISGVFHHLNLKYHMQMFIAILIVAPILYGCKTWSVIFRESTQVDEVLSIRACRENTWAYESNN